MQAEPQAELEPQMEAHGESAAPAEQREQVATDRDDDESDDEGGSGPSYVTPLVRRLASEHGVNLADVQGTGVGGRIRKQDVLDAAGQSGGRADGKAPAKQEDKPKQQSDTPVEAPAAKKTTAPAKATADQAT